MSVRRLSVAVVAALIVGAGLATPAAARALDQSPDPTAYGSTPDRLWALAAALLALGSAILGGWALARSKRRTGRKPATLGLGLALFAMVNGVLVVVTADGGPGTGNGIVGGYIAIVLGLGAVAPNMLARSRSRRTTPDAPES